MKPAGSIKRQLYDQCMQYVNDCILNAQTAIQEATQSGNSEIKSSAGDKHETARAMAQLEQEKVVKQLITATELKQQLDKINPHLISSVISAGSVVETDRFNFYISIAAGKVEINNKQYITISPVSPMAKQLMGLKAKDQIVINKHPYQITAIF